MATRTITVGLPPGVVTDDDLAEVATTGDYNDLSNLPTLGTAAAAAATDFAAAADALGYVNHGASASTARPTGYAAIVWVGTVEPTNAMNGDIWEDLS